MVDLLNPTVKICAGIFETLGVILINIDEIPTWRRYNPSERKVDRGEKRRFPKSICSSETKYARRPKVDVHVSMIAI